MRHATRRKITQGYRRYLEGANDVRQSGAGLYDNELVTEESIEEVALLPNDFVLHQNYPNPFNSVTTIRYDLPEASDVTLIVYDILGREVKALVSSWQEAGGYNVVWDAGDIPSGIYFYRLEAGNFSATRKLILLK